MYAFDPFVAKSSVTIPCSNNDEFSNSQNNFFIQGIRSEFVDTNQKGDIIYTKNSIYKKFPNYNDANDLKFFICNGVLLNKTSSVKVWLNNIRFPATK